MCFALFMAADSRVPDIDWDPDARRFHTTPLGEQNAAVRSVFTKPNVKYLGSSNHCGCGFRHLTFQNGDWPEEFMIGTDPEFGNDTQHDHDALTQFLSQFGKTEAEVELYGCWEGQQSKPPAKHASLHVDELKQVQFFFHERCHYTVRLNS